MACLEDEDEENTRTICRHNRSSTVSMVARDSARAARFLVLFFEKQHLLFYFVCSKDG